MNDTTNPTERKPAPEHHGYTKLTMEVHITGQADRTAYEIARILAEDGATVLGYRLLKVDPTKPRAEWNRHDVTLAGECQCGDATFRDRPGGCRHVAALRVHGLLKPAKVRPLAAAEANALDQMMAERGIDQAEFFNVFPAPTADHFPAAVLWLLQHPVKAPAKARTVRSRRTVATSAN